MYGAGASKQQLYNASIHPSIPHPLLLLRTYDTYGVCTYFVHPHILHTYYSYILYYIHTYILGMESRSPGPVHPCHLAPSPPSPSPARARGPPLPCSPWQVRDTTQQPLRHPKGGNRQAKKKNKTFGIRSAPGFLTLQCSVAESTIVAPEVSEVNEVRFATAGNCASRQAEACPRRVVAVSLDESNLAIHASRRLDKGSQPHGQPAEQLASREAREEKEGALAAHSRR